MLARATRYIKGAPLASPKEFPNAACGADDGDGELGAIMSGKGALGTGRSHGGELGAGEAADGSEAGEGGGGSMMGKSGVGQGGGEGDRSSNGGGDSITGSKGIDGGCAKCDGGDGGGNGVATSELNVIVALGLFSIVPTMPPNHAEVMFWFGVVTSVTTAKFAHSSLSKLIVTSMTVLPLDTCREMTVANGNANRRPPAKESASNAVASSDKTNWTLMTCTCLCGDSGGGESGGTGGKHGGGGGGANGGCGGRGGGGKHGGGGGGASGGRGGRRGNGDGNGGGLDGEAGGGNGGTDTMYASTSASER